MAKRVIHECDLTKQEFDPENDKVFTLTIAVKGRKAPMKYEVSATAAEKLLAQLNGSNELEEDWSFYNGDYAPATAESSRRTLGDLEEDEFESDAGFVKQKKAELREAGIIDNEDEEPAQPTTAKQRGCNHMNKGRIQTTMRNKKRFIYRMCQECRKQIPEKSKDNQAAYLNAEVSGDIRIRDLD